MTKILFYILFSLPLSYCYGQSDSLNQIDTNGRKQGHWVFYGADKPEKGWCSSCKINEGTYKENRKVGVWTTYYQDGVTPKSKITYVNGRVNGAYKQYYPNGSIKETGRFIGRWYRGEIIKYYESGCIQRKSFYNKEGELEDDYIYFNGCEIEYQKVKNENGGYTVTYFHRNGDVKKIEELDALGNIISRSDVDSTQLKKKPVVIGKSTPCPYSELVRQDKLFKKNGYNKLYNHDDNLYLDGQFRNGCLWSGKYYIYTEDGLLLKIEIWKNGKYHSDGQL